MLLYCIYCSVSDSFTLHHILKATQVAQCTSNPFPLPKVWPSVVCNTVSYLAVQLRPVLMSGSFNLGEAFPMIFNRALNVFIVISFLSWFSFLFVGAPESRGPPQSHHPLHQPVQL